VRVAFAFFAESVDTTVAGRLDVGGVGANMIKAPWFPTAPVALFFVCRLEAVAVECDVEHQLRFDVIDADGDQVSPPWDLRLRPDRSFLSRGRVSNPPQYDGLTSIFRHPGLTQCTY
jgi:hypothetical protein